MGGSRRPAESLKTNEQPTEKKKGLVDWMNLIKPANEEKDHWVTLDATWIWYKFQYFIKMCLYESELFYLLVNDCDGVEN